MAKAAQTAPAAPPTPSVQIVSRKDGFRRAGISHTTAPTIYPAGDLTQDQLDQLEAEPMLIVIEIPAAAPAAPAAAT